MASTLPGSSACELVVRLPKSYRRIGWAGIGFFALFGIGVIGSTIFGSTPIHEMVFALAVVIFFVTISVYLLLLTHHYRLRVYETGITESGLVKTKTIEFRDVLRLKWMLGGGGGASIRGRDGRISLRGDQCEKEDWRAIVLRLREQIDRGLQEGWEPFETRYIAPDAVELERRSRNTRRAYLVAFIGTMIFAALFLLGGFSGAGPQFFVMGVLNLLVAVFFAWRIRSRKHSHQRD